MTVGFRFASALTLVAVASLTSLGLVGCSSDPGADPSDPAETGEPGETPSTSGGGTTAPVRSNSDGGSVTQPNPNPSGPEACTEVAAPASVVESPLAFVTVKGSVAPPVLKGGGELKGAWRSEKVTVYLPESANLLLDPAKSSGKVKAWARFDGTNYRLTFDADISIQTLGSPQTEKLAQLDVGTYSASSEKLALKTTCPQAAGTQPLPEASFSVNGTKAQIMVKISSQFGDAYLLLDAVKI